LNVKIAPQPQTPERITNAIAYSKSNELFYVMTYDTSIGHFGKFKKLIRNTPSFIAFATVLVILMVLFMSLLF